MYLTNELETICFLAEIKSYPQYGIIGSDFSII